MDPNRYSKNRHIRPDSGWKILQALLTLALVICGLLGIAVHLFSNESGPADWLQWLMASPMNIVIAVATLLALFVFHRYISHLTNQQRRSASDFPVYVMMLLGAYFLYQLLTTGHW
jgi:Kef-type K+ transport system membrane component KefB